MTSPNSKRSLLLNIPFKEISIDVDIRTRSNPVFNSTDKSLYLAGSKKLMNIINEFLKVALSKNFGFVINLRKINVKRAKVAFIILPLDLLNAIYAIGG